MSSLITKVRVRQRDRDLVVTAIHPLIENGDVSQSDMEQEFSVEAVNEFGEKVLVKDPTLIFSSELPKNPLKN